MTGPVAADMERDRGEIDKRDGLSSPATKWRDVIRP